MINDDRYFEAKTSEVIEALVRKGGGTFGAVTFEDLRTTIRMALKEVERDERHAIIDVVRERFEVWHELPHEIERDLMNTHPKLKEDRNA